MKKYISIFVLTVALALTTNNIMAQPGFDDDVNDVPVDGGISLLVGAAVALGASRFVKKNDNK